MQEIASFVGLPLRWDRTSLFKADYQLKSGEVLVGTLRLHWVWGPSATAQSADGCWTFKRVGFWVTRTAICPCNSEEDIALFKRNIWRSVGTLRLPDGRRYLVKTTYANILYPSYEFQTEASEPLIYYHNCHVFSSTEVTIFPKAQELPELPWMVMLGWYVTILVERKRG